MYNLKILAIYKLLMVLILLLNVNKAQIPKNGQNLSWFSGNDKRPE